MDTADLRDRLMAIVAADVAGYSRLMADDERATIAALDAARDVFRRCVEGRSGRIVDTAGDSVLAVFDTAAGAVETALAIQAKLAAAGVGTASDRKMHFRIGVHLGDVVEKADGSVYGNGVNVAARLQALATPGGIWVSEAVRSTLGERTGCAFDDQGQHQVKNIAEPIHAYRLFSPTQAGSLDNGNGVSPTADLARGRARRVPHNLPLNPQELIGREGARHDRAHALLFPPVIARSHDRAKDRASPSLCAIYLIAAAAAAKRNWAPRHAADLRVRTRTLHRYPSL